MAGLLRLEVRPGSRAIIEGWFHVWVNLCTVISGLAAAMLETWSNSQAEACVPVVER